MKKRWAIGVAVVATFLVGIFTLDRALSPGSNAASSTSVIASASPSSIGASNTPRITATQSDNTKGLSDAAVSFAKAYWEYGPNDSPADVKARATKLVSDPAKFNWQTSFGVTYATRKVSIDPTTIDIEPFDATSFYVSMRVDTVTTDALTKEQTSHMGDSNWGVYFVKVGQKWLAEAEEDPSLPLPSSTTS